MVIARNKFEHFCQVYNIICAYIYVQDVVKFANQIVPITYKIIYFILYLPAYQTNERAPVE